MAFYIYKLLKKIKIIMKRKNSIYLKSFLNLTNILFFSQKTQRLFEVIRFDFFSWSGLNKWPLKS